MSVYHITHTPGLSEICLYLDSGCQFSCHGCITSWHPLDCHLRSTRAEEHKSVSLSIDQVISCLSSLVFKKAIFLGKEPTEDEDFLPIAKILKEKFSTYNIFLTNGYKYINNKVLDEVCVSIKTISPEIFKDFTGKSNHKQVIKNFKKYVNISHMKVRAESVFIPNYIDKDEIEKIARFIAKVDPEIPYRIDAYIPYSQDDRFKRPSKEEMEEVKEISRRYLKNVSILYLGVNVKYKVERIY